MISRPVAALRRLTVLLALTSALGPALATEVSPAEKVETTPGLSPEAVREAFDRQREGLGQCARLATEPTRAGERFAPWEDAPGTDDRVRLRFVIRPDGKVETPERPGSVVPPVEAAYLDTRCARGVLRTWSFPSFPANERDGVQVEVWARFRTTAAERRAQRTRIGEELQELCRRLSALGTRRPPSEEALSKVFRSFLSQRGAGLPLRLRSVLEALSYVEASSLRDVYVESAEEVSGTRPDCPVLRQWAAPR